MKLDKCDDEASKLSKTSASNTRVVDESSNRDKDRPRRRVPRDGIPLSTLAEITIHKKLEWGYLVSVKLGQKLLGGVLHHHTADKQQALSESQAEGLSTEKVATASNQATSYQLQPRIDLNRPPLSPVLPGLDPPNQPGSTSDISCDPAAAPQSNVLSQSNEVQQNPLSQSNNNEEKLTQLRNLQSLNSEAWALLEHNNKMLLSKVLRLESQISALKQMLHPNLTVEATETALQGDENPSQVPRIQPELNSNPIQSQLNPNPSIPEDTERPGETTESDELVGNKKNTDTSK